MGRACCPRSRPRQRLPQAGRPTSGFHVPTNRKASAPAPPAELTPAASQRSQRTTSQLCAAFAAAHRTRPTAATSTEPSPAVSQPCCWSSTRPSARTKAGCRSPRYCRMAMRPGRSQLEQLRPQPFEPPRLSQFSTRTGCLGPTKCSWGRTSSSSSSSPSRSSRALRKCLQPPCWRPAEKRWGRAVRRLQRRRRRHTMRRSGLLLPARRPRRGRKRRRRRWQRSKENTRGCRGSMTCCWCSGPAR